ncbi:hypothetical protein [Actinomadura rugatobispora]|uniref:ESX-1 secretion-associated protein n=1 Tax=Actinomadura rugatobispora TaxID=1994 RepID=A0ABW1ABH1_9ACTN
MSNTQVSHRRNRIKQAGEDVLEGASFWALASRAITVHTAIPGDAFGSLGAEVGIVESYQVAAREMAHKIDDGADTLGKTAAALWKAADAYDGREKKVAQHFLLAIRALYSTYQVQRPR